ncbi:MAG: hypothetical protein ACRECX_12160 [Methyloceanibacter sp.]|uniref:hypothetical protein n=1 Tax=Methyloceanibacter sp. TaxID=1965321 RepID=UPI003D6CC6A4
MTTMTIQQNRKRRIMREFKIDELSAVDRPAQAHALMTVMKRDDRKDDDMQLSKIASYDTLSDAVAAVAKAEGCPRHVAMSRAAREFPDLVERHRAEGREAIAKAQESARAPRPLVTKAVLAFQDKVELIAKRRGVPRHEAMSIARELYADEYHDAYGGAA